MSLWPPGFARIPSEQPWTRAPVATLAQKYDAVGQHGWYANLDATVEDVTRSSKAGDIVVDYSGGTGLLIERLLDTLPGVGFVNVDSSPKFLALSLEKWREDPRVAFRLIAYLKEQKRLATLDAAIAGPLAERGVDGIVSANAVHLYRELPETVASWARVLRPGGFVHVQSGNIRDPRAPAGAWIIDDTVEAVNDAARAMVLAEPRYARHRAALDDTARIEAHDAFRAKVFLAPRPLGYYREVLEQAGLVVERVWSVPITAKATEWHTFLGAYSDAVLGWVGGTERIEGRPPSSEDVADRLALMRLALDTVLKGSPTFQAQWVYIRARKPL